MQISQTEINFLQSFLESGGCVVLFSTKGFGHLALISLLRHFVNSPYPVTALSFTSMPDFGCISVLTGGATVVPTRLDLSDHSHWGSATSLSFTRDRVMTTQAV